MEVPCIAPAYIWYQVILISSQNKYIKHLFALQGEISASKMLCLNL